MSSPSQDQLSFGGEPLPAVGVHKHLCCFYRTHAEMELHWIAFLLDGLKHNEKCILVVGDDYSIESATGALSAIDSVACQKYRSTGQLSIVNNDGFPTSLQATAPEIIEFWRVRLEAACNEGWASIRVAAQMTWWPESRRNSDVVPIYEFLANELFPKLPMSAICMYDKTIFSEHQMERVVAVHPFIGHLKQNGDAVCHSSREFIVQQAIEAGKSAHKLNAAITEIYASATALLKEERFSEAEKLYEEAVARSETNLAKVSALLGLVQTLRAQGKSAQAAKVEDTATSLLLTRIP